MHLKAPWDKNSVALDQKWFYLSGGLHWVWAMPEHAREDCWPRWRFNREGERHNASSPTNKHIIL